MKSYLLFVAIIVLIVVGFEMPGIWKTINRGYECRNSPELLGFDFGNDFDFDNGIIPLATPITGARPPIILTPLPTSTPSFNPTPQSQPSVDDVLTVGVNDVLRCDPVDPYENPDKLSPYWKAQFGVWGVAFLLFMGLINFKWSEPTPTSANPSSVQSPAKSNLPTSPVPQQKNVKTLPKEDEEKQE